MKRIIFLLIISLFFSCKTKDDAVKIHTKRVNPHKLNKYPDPYRRYNQWKD